MSAPDVVEVRVGLDPSEIDAINKRLMGDIKKVETAGKLATQKILSGLRKTAQMAILFTEAASGTLDAMYRYMIEAGVMGVELFVTMATADSLTFIGGVRAGIQLIAITSMLVQIANLKAGRTQTAEAMGRTTNLFRYLALLTY